MENIYLQKIEKYTRFKYKILVFEQDDQNRKLILNRIGELLSEKNYIITVGTHIYSYSLYEEKKPIIRLFLWEMSNEPRFTPLEHLYFKGTTSVIFFYFANRPFNFEFYKKKITGLKQKLPEQTLFYFISIFPKQGEETDAIQIEKLHSDLLENKDVLIKLLGEKSQFYIIHTVKDVHVALYSLGKDLLNKGEILLTKDLGLGFSRDFLDHLDSLNLQIIDDKWIEIPYKKGYFKLDIFTANLYYSPKLYDFSNYSIVNLSQTKIVEKKELEELDIEVHELRILNLIYSILEENLSIISG